MVKKIEIIDNGEEMTTVNFYNEEGVQINWDQFPRSDQFRARNKLLYAFNDRMGKTNIHY